MVGLELVLKSPKPMNFKFLGIKCLFFITFCIGIGRPIFGQRYIYPIKLNHKWGYIDKKGTVIIEPKYDLIAESYLAYFDPTLETKKSPFKLVKLNDYLGLIDDQEQKYWGPPIPRYYP